MKVRTWKLLAYYINYGSLQVLGQGKETDFLEVPNKIHFLHTHYRHTGSGANY